MIKHISHRIEYINWSIYCLNYNRILNFKYIDIIYKNKILFLYFINHC